MNSQITSDKEPLMRIQLFSFFSGLGLLDLGFEEAGFSIEFVNESNSRYLRAYKYARRNNKHAPRYGYYDKDVKNLLSDEQWESIFPDYNERGDRIIGFIGGPPCPDFSVAGKNEGKDGANGQLTSVYSELIIKRLPDFFVFENVKGLYQTTKHRSYYEEIKQQLQDAGYHLYDSIENALEYGVPQYRDRLFLVGFLSDRFRFIPQGCLGEHKQYDLSDLLSLPWPSTSAFIADKDCPCPSGIQHNLTVEYWFRKNDVENHPNGKDCFRAKAKNRFESIPEGETKGKSFKRLHRWRYSPTAAYGNNEVHLHPYKPRRISVAEALAIQSAPSSMVLPADMPLSTKFKMVGNGVPVLLSKGIAQDVLSVIYSNNDKKERKYERIL